MKKQISIKSIKEKKRKSAYIRDSDLRMILTKFNMNYQKKKKLYYNEYMFYSKQKRK